MRANLCKFEDLVDGSARLFAVGETDLAIVRVGEECFALADECSHQKVSLSDGEFDLESFALECPKHGSGFCLRTGAPTALPATQPVAVYEVVIDEHGEVFVEVGDE
jgi:3-phenylpropionate/trans-cinnamate dioxygenase ferredoxin subunit